MRSSRRRAAVWVLGGGVVAATLDILYAWVFWRLMVGVSMERVLQSVAAGLLGRASFQGGARTAILGFALHYLIATTMSVTYYQMAGWWPLLARRPWSCGAVYGLLLYGVMNLVVVPLSAAGRGSRDPLWIVLSVLVHVAFIGIPLALATSAARGSGRTV